MVLQKYFKIYCNFQNVLKNAKWHCEILENIVIYFRLSFLEMLWYVVNPNGQIGHISKECKTLRYQSKSTKKGHSKNKIKVEKVNSK